jgi:hypothetical protein
VTAKADAAVQSRAQAKEAAARLKAEREYASRWGRCSGYQLDRPLNEERTAMRPHRRYVEVAHDPGQVPGLMIGCSGVGLPPVSLSVEFSGAEDDAE